MFLWIMNLGMGQLSDFATPYGINCDHSLVLSCQMATQENPRQAPLTCLVLWRGCLEDLAQLDQLT